MCVNIVSNNYSILCYLYEEWKGDFDMGFLFF